MPVISYGLDATGLKRGVKTVNSSLASISSKARSIGSTLGKMFNPLTAAIGGVGIALSAVKLASVGDQYTNMAGQLEYLTGSTENAEIAQEQLYQMSQKTGTLMTSNASAFTRFALASNMTKLSTEQNIEVLGNINTLLAKTGVSGQEASSGMIQLGQALASGRLQGDEFRSLSENLPALMNELADSLGVTRQELKEMGAAGELTSELLGQSFLQMGQSINDGTAELPLTIGRTWTKIVNATQRMWDKINDETGILSFVAQGFENLAIWVEQNTDTVVKFFVDFGNAAVQYWPVVKKFFEQLYIYGKVVIDWFKNNPEVIPNFIGRMVQSINTAFPILTKFFGLLSSVLNFIGKVTASAGAIAGTMIGEHQAGTPASLNSLRDAAVNAWNDPYLTGGGETQNTNVQGGDVNINVSESQSRSDIENIAVNLKRNEVRG